MKNLFNVAVMAMALCVFQINVVAQDKTSARDKTIDVFSVIHEETFEHSYVILKNDNGDLVMGFYKVTAKFDGNYPISLTYVLSYSTDDELFKSIPIKGEFESDRKSVGGVTAFQKFEDMFTKIFKDKFVEMKFER